MLAVLNLVVGVLGFFGFLFYSSLVVLAFMLSPLVSSDKLPYYTVTLTLCTAALMACTLTVGLVAGIFILHKNGEARKLAMVLAGVAGLLAVTNCLVLALSPVIPDRQFLAQLVGPGVVVSGLYCGGTLAVWLRGLVRGHATD